MDHPGKSLKHCDFSQPIEGNQSTARVETEKKIHKCLPEDILRKTWEKEHE